MNWRKGWLRLWLVLSLCWIVGIAVFAWHQEQARADQEKTYRACFARKEAEGANPFTCPSEGPAYHIDELWRLENDTMAARLKGYAINAFLPPLAALALGLLGVWVISGFTLKGAGKAEEKS
jgi:hypothetical protein